RLRYRLDPAGWNALLERLHALRYRGAIVGPCGSGKTTLLEELRRRIEAMRFATAYLRLPSERRPPRAGELRRFHEAASPRTVLLLDGGEQLGALQWLRLLRAARDR